MAYLLALWDEINNNIPNTDSPALIYRDDKLIVRVVKDYFKDDIEEILIDDKDTFNEAKEFIDAVLPDHSDKVKLYEEEIPLFNRYQIESQIELAFQREISLSSGGSIVIDPTEAKISSHFRYHDDFFCWTHRNNLNGYPNPWRKGGFASYYCSVCWFSWGSSGDSALGAIVSSCNASKLVRVIDGIDIFYHDPAFGWCRDQCNTTGNGQVPGTNFPAAAPQAPAQAANDLPF